MKTNLGIYKIINIESNKIYVGSSINLKSRKYRHFWELERNKHGNEHLQNSYNKYGKENFKWEIIEYAEFNEDKEILRKNLLEREQYYLDLYFGENCYNLNPTASSRLGTKHTIEVRKKISANNGRYFLGREFSESHKINIGKASLGRNNKKIINMNTNIIFENIMKASEFYGISVSHIGEVCSGKRKTCGGLHFRFLKDLEENPLLIKDIGKPIEIYKPKYPSFKGRKHSEETKQKLRDRGKSRNISPETIQKMIESNNKTVINITENKIFSSIREASEYYNINASSISSVCRGRRKTAGGFSWIYG